MLRTGTGAPVISAMRSLVSRKVPCTAALDHALLQFVGERACGQLQRFVQRVDAPGARLRVAHAGDLDGAKDGLQHTSMQPPVGVKD